MPKWIITNIWIYKNYWIKYDWFIDFRVWDKYYHCSNIDNFMKSYSRNRHQNIDNVRWSDFRVLWEYKKSNKWVIFEIELIDKEFNPNREKTYIYWEK